MLDFMIRHTLLFLTLPAVLWADELKFPERKLPPVGVAIPGPELEHLRTEISTVRKTLAGLEKNPLLPDVEVYLESAALAVENGEFYAAKDTALAQQQLQTAAARIAELKAGKASWTTQKGLVVRGYRSSVDGSAQPFGVELRDDYDFKGKAGPMYVWLHGRGDKETNLYYLKHCETKKGQFPPPSGTLTIFPFGRHCMGYKSAGEMDVIEAVEAAQKMYPVDVNRIALMGFSMGGAGAWHLGAHYAHQWAVVHPGAGFVDVEKYTKLTPDKMPLPIEQALWGIYDVPKYARNYLNIPLVAYSGELDAQKAAADLMEAALKAEGLKMTHLIGPGMPHKYHPQVIKEVQKFIDEALVKGRQIKPAEIHLQTRTLRYNQFRWLEITSLAKHWEDSRVDAKLTGTNLQLTTKNITSLRLDPKLGASSIEIDGTKLSATSSLSRIAGSWQPSPPRKAGLQKQHGLQGPMDDVLLTPFLVVMPAHPSPNPIVQRWVQFEAARFAKQWRELFRGNLRIKTDSEVTKEDIENFSLICWGDPTSNSVIARTHERLPIRWDPQGNVLFKGKSHPAATTIPALIYPNPANPQRYIVINNGCSFREGHSSTNALQNPKLGDYALFDLTQPPDGLSAGKIIDTGFFDEQWNLSAP
jgi:hypothetical protein